MTKWKWYNNWLMHEDGAGHVLFYTNDDDGLHGEEADKLMIAAAPDLLEACRQLVIAQSGYPMTGIQAEQYLQNAFAAIDKATGQ